MFLPGLIHLGSPPLAFIRLAWKIFVQIQLEKSCVHLVFDSFDDLVVRGEDGADWEEEANDVDVGCVGDTFVVIKTFIPDNSTTKYQRLFFCSTRVEYDLNLAIFLQGIFNEMCGRGLFPIMNLHFVIHDRVSRVRILESIYKLSELSR